VFIVSAAMLLLRCSMQLLCSCLFITDSCYSCYTVNRMFWVVAKGLLWSFVCLRYIVCLLCFFGWLLSGCKVIVSVVWVVELLCCC